MPLHRISTHKTPKFFQQAFKKPDDLRPLEVRALANSRYLETLEKVGGIRHNS